MVFGTTRHANPIGRSASHLPAFARRLLGCKVKDSFLEIKIYPPLIESKL